MIENPYDEQLFYIGPLGISGQFSTLNASISHSEMRLGENGTEVKWTS